MKNIDWFGVFLFGATALSVLMVLGLFFSLFYINKNAAKYIPIHNCVIVSYAGEDAEPIYQCDTGLKRKRDMLEEKK